jgi:hypothetical protein
LSRGCGRNARLSIGFVGACICSILIGFAVAGFGFECFLDAVITGFGSILNVRAMLRCRIFIVISLFVIGFLLISLALFDNYYIHSLSFCIYWSIKYSVRKLNVIYLKRLYIVYQFPFFC